MASSTQRLVITCLWSLLGIPALVMAYDTSFCRHRSTGLHSDPQDCQAFYLCHSTRTSHSRCPINLLFNPKRKSCDWPRAVQCLGGGNRATTSAPFTTRPRKTTIQSRVKSTEFCQNKASGIYGDPTSCKHFFQCHNGKTYRTQCRHGTLYNAQMKYCDWEANVRCSSKPNPTSPPTTPPPTTRPPTSSPRMTTRTTKGQSATSAPNPSSGSQCPRVVCYFTNWSQYRYGGAKFEAKDVDPLLCTHIIYAFAGLIGNQLKGREWNDERTFKVMTNHKTANPRLKLLLAVGGWNMGTGPFTAMVATRESRKEFIGNVIRFLRDRNFDGLDLDWEYPTKNGSPRIDKQRFVLLCQELRAAFEAESLNTGKSRLLLSAAVAAGKTIIDDAYNIAPINAALDFINLMAYDFHGGWDSVTGHNSPLYSGSWDSGLTAYFSVRSAVDVWLGGGADRDKLVVGLPLYARSFRLTHPSNNGVQAPASGAGSPGRHTNEAGYLSYYEVCMLRDAGASRHFIEEQRVPYLVAGGQWVGYDDRASLREKVRYIKSMKLGGAMVWDLSLDDFSGSFCGEGKHPLMNAIVNECKVS